MAANQDAIYWYQVARLKMHDITNEDIVDRNLLRFPRSDNLHRTVFFLLVQLHKLSFLLPVINCANYNHNDNCSHNRNSFNPFNFCFARFMLLPKRLVKAQSKRNNGGNREEYQNLIIVG